MNYKISRFHISKKVIVFVLVVLFLLLAVMEVSARRTVNVEVNEYGFHPSVIDIQPGQKVVWKASGQNRHWPASNSHPTHTEYKSETSGCLGSALDACQALNEGDTFSFVFKESGSWGVHDHLRPGNVMSVNVSSRGAGWFGKIVSTFDRLIARLFRSNAPWPLAKDFKNLSYDAQLQLLQEYSTENPAGAWQYLKDAFIVDGVVVQPAHEFGHVIGNAAYKKHSMQGVRICDASFGYGCFHGVTEQAVQQLSSKSDLSGIERECSSLNEDVNKQNCYHGIGHGVASVNGLDLSTSLSVCDTLQEINREFCHDGVMMEQVYSSKARDVEESDPWKVCSNLDVSYHKACGNYQAARLSVAGWNFEQIIKSCSSTDIVMLKKQCSRASGYASVNENWRHPQMIINKCGLALDQEDTEWCLTAAASDFAFQAYSGWQEATNAICSSISTGGSRNECHNEVKANSP